MKILIAGLVSIFEILIGVSTGLCWTVPGTNVSLCYNNSDVITCPSASEGFYGQDGNFQTIAHVFRDNNNDTITDAMTGLTWQKTIYTQTKNWTNANNYCETATFAGLSDWRLPTIEELLTIVDFSKSGSRYYSQFGLSTSSDNYWSSTSWHDHTGYYLYANFDYGSTAQSDTSGLNLVRCVRGTSLAHSLKDNSNGTITDSKTSLTWEKTRTYSKTWEEALDYCKNSTTGGYTDWILPSVLELETLVNYAASPAQYSVVSEYGEEYHTRTPDSSYLITNMKINFNDGSVYRGFKNTTSWVRCVRRSTSVSASLYPDSDDDGVIDALDQCPNTPSNTPVDKHGCPNYRTIVIPLMGK